MNWSMLDLIQIDHTFYIIANLKKIKSTDKNDNNFVKSRAREEQCLCCELFFLHWEFFCSKNLRNSNFQFEDIQKHVTQIFFPLKFVFKVQQLKLMLHLNYYQWKLFQLQDTFELTFPKIKLIELLQINKIGKILNAPYSLNI